MKMEERKKASKGSTLINACVLRICPSFVIARCFNVGKRAVKLKRVWGVLIAVSQRALNHNHHWRY